MRMPNVREVFERTYRIVYQIGDQAIFVLTVFDGQCLFRVDEVER
jgi:hypothetical protein